MSLLLKMITGIILMLAAKIFPVIAAWAIVLQLITAMLLLAMIAKRRRELII